MRLTPSGFVVQSDCGRHSGAGPLRLRGAPRLTPRHGRAPAPRTPARPRRERPVRDRLRQRRLVDLLRARPRRQLRARPDAPCLRITGVFFYVTAATYAEATTMYPSFARRAFNEFWSFFAAWGQMLNY